MSSKTGSPRAGRRRRPEDDGPPCPQAKRGQRLLRLCAIGARLDMAAMRSRYEPPVRFLFVDAEM